MAYLKQRGGKWYAVWRERGAKITKATNIPIKGAREEKLARATADAMEAAAKNPSMVASALNAVRATAELTGHAAQIPTTVDYFTTIYEPGGKEQSKLNSRRAFEKFLEFLGPDKVKPLDAIKPSTCKAFLKAQLERVSYGTVSRYQISIRAAYNSAVNDGLISKSPFAGLSLSKIAPADMERKTHRLPFTMQEMAYILTKFPKVWQDLVLTSFATGGQRLGDVVCLKWTNVDFTNKTVLFRTMKTGKRIIAPMVPQLEAMLRSRYIEGETHVFPFMAGTYMKGSGKVSTEFTALLRAAGIGVEEVFTKKGDRRRVSRKSFHSIRHTVVSGLRSSMMVSADLARAIVGHDSEAIEREYFTAASDDKLNGLLYLMNAVDAQKGGEP